MNPDPNTPQPLWTVAPQPASSKKTPLWLVIGAVVLAAVLSTAGMALSMYAESAITNMVPKPTPRKPLILATPMPLTQPVPQ
ncbi:hypothetical protein EON83_28205 [bacterium]|nr:MAG: hypothetical protein EON83_28205 [bacterium]